MIEKKDIPLREALKGYPDDVFLYYGEISREGYGLLSSAIESRIAEGKKADKVCLILVTLGGDPHAAFRIARTLRHHYSFLDILIPHLCKSAGTLICIAADRLIFGDRGELGPLDVQIFKPDELSEVMSGLDIFQSLTALQNQLLESFRSCLQDIYRRTPLRTKQAAELATELAKGFIAPIVARIDPVTLGKHRRAMRVSYDYGERLNEMSEALKPGALGMLVEGYPSHGFVIDRKEAQELFKDVEDPNEESPSKTPLLFCQWAHAFISRPLTEEEKKLLPLVDVKEIMTENLTQKEDSTCHEKSASPTADKTRRESVAPSVENHCGKGSKN